jgi:hypothetical protein
VQIRNILTQFNELCRLKLNFASITVLPIVESAPRLQKMSSRTMCITQEGPANALALNKDYSQVVIAGRNGNTLIVMYSSIITWKRAPILSYDFRFSRRRV